MARKRFGNEIKARVALETIKGDKAVAQLSSQCAAQRPDEQIQKRIGAD